MNTDVIPNAMEGNIALIASIPCPCCSESHYVEMIIRGYKVHSHGRLNNWDWISMLSLQCWLIHSLPNKMHVFQNILYWPCNFPWNIWNLKFETMSQLMHPDLCLGRSNFPRVQDSLLFQIGLNPVRSPLDKLGSSPVNIFHFQY